MQTTLLERSEKEYIRSALDEIMTDMGYVLVGGREHVAKRTGRKTRHALYKVTGGVAVDVTYAENGQISMELGGLDGTDRTPTPAEAESLASDMRAFCGDYREFVRRLREKGILIDEIGHLPPEPQYAQIINTNDYDLNRPVETYSAAAHRHAADSAKHVGE